MPVIDNKQVGKRIKQIRTSYYPKKISQAELGELLNPPAIRPLVSKWEKGLNLPNNDRLKQIALLGNTTVDYLLFGKQLSGLGERLTSLRTQKSLSRLDVSNLFTPPLSEQDIENWENEDAIPTFEQIKTLSFILGVDRYFLISGKERKHQLNVNSWNPYHLLEESEDYFDKSDLDDSQRRHLDFIFFLFETIRLQYINDPEYTIYASKILQQLEDARNLNEYETSYAEASSLLKELFEHLKNRN